MYLCILLLSLSNDIETNPGHEYPCGSCGTEVFENDLAIQCDTCSQWFHINCQNVDSNTYNDLVALDGSFSWICSICDGLNFSSGSLHSLSSLSSHNSFQPLNDVTQTRWNTTQTATKPGTQKTPFKQYPKLKVICVNFQSIANKKSEFYALLDHHKPDIVVGTESWLTEDHKDCEIFPKFLGYTPFREDRSSKGGGVFILVKDTILATEQKQLKTNCEILWIKIHLTSCKPLYIAAYYRPKEADVQSSEEFRKSLELTANLKGNFWILGDFNYPKLSWDTEHRPTIKPGCSNVKLYDDFIDLLADFNLTQMVTEKNKRKQHLGPFPDL
jgi:hypothetical protein